MMGRRRGAAAFFIFEAFQSFFARMRAVRMFVKWIQN